MADQTNDLAVLNDFQTAPGDIAIRIGNFESEPLVPEGMEYDSETGVPTKLGNLFGYTTMALNKMRKDEGVIGGNYKTVEMEVLYDDNSSDSFNVLAQ